MKTSLSHYLSISLACALVGQATALERKELLPERAAVTVRLSSAPGFVAAVDRAPFGRLWRDPQMQAFLGKPPVGEALLRQLLVAGANDPDAPATKVTAAAKEIQQLEFEMLKMLSGEVIFGFDPLAEHTEPWILATLSRTNYDRSLTMDRRMAELKPGTLTINRARFQEFDLYSFTRKIDAEEENEDEDVADDATAPNTATTKPAASVAKSTVSRHWQCYVGQTLVSGPDEAWVKATITRLAKETPKEPAGDPELTARVDIPRLLAAATKAEAARAAARRRAMTTPNAKSATATSPQAPDLAAILKGVGLGNVGVLDARLTLKSTGCTADLSLPIGEPRKGVLALLDANPSSTALRVPFVSEQTVAYSVGRLDLRALWKAIPGMIAVIAPDASSQFMCNAMVNQAVAMLGVDLDADLLAHLGTQMISASSLQKDDLSQVLAFELRNEQAFQASLAKIFAEGGQARAALGKGLTIEKAGEQSVYVIGAGGPQAPVGASVDAGAAPRATAAPVQRFALTTAGGYFFFGEESAVRQALQVQATPDRAARFYAGPLFQRLQRSVPKGAVSYEITDCARAVRALLTKLTAEQGILPALLAQCSSGLNLPATTADISKLPPASHIASFFGPLLSTTELRDGRIVAHLEGVYPEGR